MLEAHKGFGEELMVQSKSDRKDLDKSGIDSAVVLIN